MEPADATKGAKALRAGDRENDTSGKPQRRVALIAVPTSDLPGDQHTLPTVTSPSVDRQVYNHLLHWGRDEGDEIVDWDKEDWGQEEDDDDDEDDEDIDDEEADCIQDTVEDAEDATKGLDYNDLEAAEIAVRDVRTQSHARAGKVAKEDVIRIINERMEAFTKEWSPSKDPELALNNNNKQSLDPIRLWEDAEAVGLREGLVERYKWEKQHYESKLDILAAEICKIPQNSEKQVRQHCKNLEVHVHNLEAAKWYLSIYELPPVGSEHDSFEEPHALVTQGSARHNTEIIDLGSSTESSPCGDDREILTNGGFERKEHLKRHLNNRSDAETYKCTVCGFDTERNDNFQIHLEHCHKRGGPRTDVAGTIFTPHRKDDIEMVLNKTPIAEPDMAAPKALDIIRLRGTASKSEHFSPVEPGTVPVSPIIPRSRKMQKPHGSRPEIASILTVSRWSMRDLVVAKDRKRLVMKVMLEMSRQEREIIQKRIRVLKKSNVLNEISMCIGMLYKKEEKILGVLPSDLPKIKAITKFFLCWWLADDYMNNIPTDQQLHELVAELPQCNDLEIFYDWVYFIVHKTFSEESFRNAHAPSQEEIIIISDDDDGDGVHSVSSSSRKKPTPKRKQAQHVSQGIAGAQPTTASLQGDEASNKRVQVRHTPQNDVVMLE